MPICPRACDEKKPQSPALQAEWREPPGRLGEYVRRIKAWSDPARFARLAQK